MTAVLTQRRRARAHRRGRRRVRAPRHRGAAAGRQPQRRQLRAAATCGRRRAVIRFGLGDGQERRRRRRREHRRRARRRRRLPRHRGLLKRVDLQGAQQARARSRWSRPARSTRCGDARHAARRTSTASSRSPSARRSCRRPASRRCSTCSATASRRRCRRSSWSTPTSRRRRCCRGRRSCSASTSPSTRSRGGGDHARKHTSALVSEITPELDGRDVVIAGMVNEHPPPRDEGRQALHRRHGRGPLRQRRSHRLARRLRADARASGSPATSC